MKKLIKKILKEEDDWEWVGDVKTASHSKELDVYLKKELTTSISLEHWGLKNLGDMGSVILDLSDDGFIVISVDESGYEVSIDYSDNEEGIINVLEYDWIQENEHRDCNQKEIGELSQIFTFRGCRII